MPRSPHGILSSSDLRLRRIRLWATTMVVVLLDQLTKLAAFKSLALGERYEVVGGLLWWTPRLNRGAAFSLFSSQVYANVLLAILSVVLAGALVLFAERRRHAAPGWAFGLVVGGALGNFIDRVIGEDINGERVRAVRDFIDVGWWPTFNLADAAITVGVLTLFAWGLLQMLHRHPDPQGR